MYTSNVEALKKALATRGGVMWRAAAEVNKLSNEVNEIAADLAKHISADELSTLLSEVYMLNTPPIK